MDPIATDERPRERMCARGVASLTDAELVAVVLGTGAPGVRLARRSRAPAAREPGRSSAG
jgi:DNA repair protein RadC